MAWKKAAITDGEIDALHRAAMAACNEDTRYPHWRSSARHGGGECLNIATWLVQRLGGHIGRARGHYVWLSPDEQYYIDLTDGHTSGWRYAPNSHTYQVVPMVEATQRATRFSRRADRLFEGLPQLMRLGLDYAGDSHPAEEPQAADDSERFDDSWTDPDQYWHDEHDAATPEGVYQFIYANGNLEVSPNHSHAELAGHAGINPDLHTGPFAAGHVVVTNGRATWEVQANVNLHSMFRILKDATKNYGWIWGGLTDANGQPLIEDFAPKKSAMQLHYVHGGGHLYLGRTSAATLGLRADRSELHAGPLVSGTIRITEDRAEVAPIHLAALDALFEWAADAGLTLYAGNDNVIKTIPDLQENNTYAPDPVQPDNPMEQQGEIDERLPSGLYSCPGCRQLFPNWHEYSRHRRQNDCVDTDHPDANGDGGLPQPDPGLYGDGAHFTEMRQEPGITTGSVSPAAVSILPARTWREAARVDGFAKYATAFKYDNDDYNFYVAYRNGDPLGYAVVDDDGGVPMVHSAIEGAGIGAALHTALTKHYDSLYTNAAHEKTAAILTHYGWLQTGPVRWKWSKGQAAKDLLDAPVPFIYDVQKDKIHVGHPGARTSDIPGKFTPGGIVEGHYEPGGKIVIQSLTSIPYTVRHLVELWYYTHPHLEVKSVHLKDDAGKDTRLAGANPDWDLCVNMRTLVAMDPAVHTASRALVRAGGSVYAVGGAVRDLLMGREPSDIDLLVTGLPAEVVQSALKKLPGRLAVQKDEDGQEQALIGRQFGTFLYRHKGHTVEIALPRREASTGPGHTDFQVTADHAMDPVADLYRRDFTVNAMAINLAYDTAEVLDPYHGREDIEAKTLRTLGAHSFAEDPLRIARGLAAVSRFGLSPDPQTLAQMRSSAPTLAHLPAERIREELDKLIGGDHPAQAIRLAHETGTLAHILPEVEACMGYDQRNPHHELELGEHLLSVLERAASRSDDPDVRLAALLHDIGKPGSAWVDPEHGSHHYYAKHVDANTVLGADHEQLGADMTRARLAALKYPNDRIGRITALVREHMWGAFTTRTGARRFLARVGDAADDLLLLRWADQGGHYLYPTDAALDLRVQAKLIKQARDAGEATTQAQLAIDGHDLIRSGMAPGPRMGQVLAHLTAQVIDDPTLNTAQTLMALAKEYNTHHEAAQVPQEDHEGQEVRLPGVRQGESPKLAQGDEEAEVEFPTAEDAQAVHDQAVEDHGQPYAALLDSGKLESAMGRAANHYHYGQGTPGERVADAAGALAHGIGMAQAFVDGNKKTAYHTTRGFLHNNGYGHLSPVEHDDEELADHLMGHGEGTHSLEDTQQMFRSRL